MGNKNQQRTWVLKCIIYTINPIHFDGEKNKKKITAQYTGELTLVE